MNKSLARALFRPRSVALVGASGDATKNTARPQRYLIKHGYKGRILPINPGRDEIMGLPAYTSVSKAPGPIDHAFIMTPAAAVPGILADCAKAGVKIASIFSDGFAETGEEGRARQEAMVKAARKAGMRLIGPNSMGVIDVQAGAAITVNAILELPELIPGSLGVVSQSGTMLGALMSRGAARGVGFSKMVSIGNEADLSVGEVADALVDDPETTAILLFLETIRDPATLAAMARRAHKAGKPVIAYKLGRSAAGRALAVSHTGAIAGDDAAADALFRDCGILRVDFLETMLEIAPLARRRILFMESGGPGRRVAVLTTTGGGAATTVDRMGLAGIELVGAPKRLREKLAPKGIALSEGPIIDLTMAGTRREIYQPTLETLLRSRENDAVVAVVGSSAQFHANIAVEPIAAAARKSDKPLAAFLVPNAEESLRLLTAAGIAAFRTPEACADAMRACLNWTPPSHPPPRPRGKKLENAAKILKKAARSASGPVLDEFSAQAVFAALGIEQVKSAMLSPGDIGSPIGYPVAAKIVSADIPHKTESGGVILDIWDEVALAEAAAMMFERTAQAHPDALIEGVMVQKMASGPAEVLIGYRVTPEAGPIVTVAPGGTLAELYRDASVRLAPVSVATAREMIDEVTGLAPVRGYRGMPLGDLDALAKAIAALSELARLPKGAPNIAEAEINPLIVGIEGDGVVAVDGLIVLAQS
ncbi:MAG: acyl-CoA synthetase (NDP forming) [Alphaproteobacteria bacterium]|jgi:acyl-CoA synthetase (NDP forming)